MSEFSSYHQARTAEEASDGHPAVRAAGKLLTQDGESPPEAYRPADPMNVG